MKSATIKIRARNLARRRFQLRKVLADSRPLLIGTVYKTRVRCGNSRCHCAKGLAHPKTLLLYKDRGKRRCKLIRLADVRWVRQAAERYKKFRRALRELRSIDSEEVQNFMAMAVKRAIRYC